MTKRKKSKKQNQAPLLVVIIAIIGYLFTTNSDLLNTSLSQEESQTPNTNVVSTDLKIYYFDVGQADSILITNNGHNMLIDAGNNEDGPKLVSYIQKELGITDFDYVVGTHPHEDHIGGLDDIINNFNVKNVYLPDVITTTKTFEDVLDAIDKKNLSITTPKIEDTFKLGEANFTVIYTGTNEKDLNSTSIVLKMIFGNYSYLFTGDATEEVEKAILNKNIDIDVLKVAHHGSEYSTTEDFLTKVTPTYAIISVGANNSYGHPSQEILNRLKKYTEKIYMTSEVGTIVLSSDGKEIEITTIKTDTNG